MDSPQFTGTIELAHQFLRKSTDVYDDEITGWLRVARRRTGREQEFTLDDGRKVLIGYVSGPLGMRYEISISARRRS